MQVDVEGVNTALLPLVRDETLDFSIGMKSAAKYAAALALLVKTDTLGLLVPHILAEP